MLCLIFTGIGPTGGEMMVSNPHGFRTENRLRWDLSPEEIRAKCAEVIAQHRKALDAVGSLDLDSITFDNTVKALAYADAEYTLQHKMLTFPRFVSPSKEVRTASTEAQQKFLESEMDLQRENIYQRIVVLGMKVDKDSLTAEDKRAVKLWVADRFNHTNPEVNRLDASNIRRMSDDVILQTKKVYDDYVGSLDPDSTTVDNISMELANINVAYIDQMNMVDYLRQVSPSEEVRKASSDAYEKLSELYEDITLMRDDVNLRIENSRCEEENSAMLKELAKLRAQQSALQGFKSHADSVLKINVTRRAKGISTFLEELAHKLKPLGDKERANLLKLNEEDCQKRGLPDRELYEHNLPHVMDKVVKIQYGVDHDQLKEYFPAEIVTRGVLDICQDLLGLSFSLVHGAPVWHRDVTLYCATDRSSGQTVGQFYLDLFAREGKDMQSLRGYCSDLQPGCLLPDGSRQMSITAIVTNFRKPTADCPSLLTHSEVTTCLHEFGHAMHDICAQVDYADFRSSQVEVDFAEVPSQLLENWAWEKEPLQRMSKHYKTGAPIPDDLLDKLIKSRLANYGMDRLRKIVWAELDLALHTKTTSDPAKEYARLCTNILGVTVYPNTPAPFCNGNGKNYCYLWGEMLSMDMIYSRFKQEGIMDPEVGLDYRKCILKPGASKDAEEMLKNFLGC